MIHFSIFITNFQDSAHSTTRLLEPRQFLHLIVCLYEKLRPQVHGCSPLAVALANVMERARGGRLQRGGRGKGRAGGAGAGKGGGASRLPAATGAHCKSELATWLGLQVLWGFFSPQFAQAIAKKASDDIDTA